MTDGMFVPHAMAFVQSPLQHLVCLGIVQSFRQSNLELHLLMRVYILQIDDAAQDALESFQSRQPLLGNRQTQPRSEQWRWDEFHHHECMSTVPMSCFAMQSVNTL